MSITVSPTDKLVLRRREGIHHINNLSPVGRSPMEKFGGNVEPSKTQVETTLTLVSTTRSEGQDRMFVQDTSKT